ncbi:GPI16 [Candida margitis]|uniref:GPI16 n=1 Tax=Candida margitis TaxID=1775924 RepID=UPI00222774D6|nr:GPI16 [Candida margitis]KAI5970252.1 GPI16 [Candida margitis]
MIIVRACLIMATYFSFVLGDSFYQETLNLRPLPRNKLLSTFDFKVQSLQFDTFYQNDSSSSRNLKESHYTLFPSSIGPIIESTNTRELSLRFTQGWWDAQSWGKLPYDGWFSGGTGVEVVALIEAPSIEVARKHWSKLTKNLSGFFCASLNFIDNDITTFPRYSISDANTGNYEPEFGNKLYLLRAALPSEPICTENLTPFLKLLPTGGKAGISSLLDGHKVFDSLWHGMSIDVVTECAEDGLCKLNLYQTVSQVIDIVRSLRKKEEGGIPKPTPGDKLRCDTSKEYNLWQCFPLSDPTELQWSLETLYGRTIKGPAFEGDQEVSKVSIDYDPSAWNITLQKESSTFVATRSLQSHGSNTIVESIVEPYDYDFKFFTSNSTKVVPIEEPPLYASRSLTGYSLDKGGLRVVFTNPGHKDVEFTYFESLPWFMRLYLSTLDVTLKNSSGVFNVNNHLQFIRSSYYKPAADRERPSHLEFVFSVPPLSTLAMTYDFDKSLLLYREYPPDANHGFDIEPAVIRVSDRDHHGGYEFRTTSLLLTLPTPDFSMPYNVIILTCTVLSLAFGTMFNLLTKKTVTEEEFELAAQNTKFSKFKRSVLSRIGKLKTKVE